VFAGQIAASQAKSDKNSSFHDAAVFWLVVLVAIALLILVAALSMRRRRRASGARLDELRQAANSTLSQADSAVQEIEGSGKKLTPDVRADYDRALGLRNRAQAEINQAGSQAGLIQANEDAAQAVLALQGVMRKAGIEGALTNPLDLPARRCFYCGRDDRPPYITRSIDDGKGNTMQVDICSVDAAQLQRGRTPQIATVQYGGSPVPWWAVPNSPWYYGYGGPSWQYWLPFMIGMDVGGWYGGGWGGYGGYGYGDFDGGQAWGNGGDWGQDTQGVGSGPTDTGAGDFGGWGGGTDVGSGDAGSWGGDAGSWGGDSGGWGGDAGGGDFGGGGDSGGGGWG
jgi:hypothetical protein